MNHKQALLLSLALGRQDIRQAYRRSKLGPFWITIGMSVQILAIGIVFGLIFRTELQDYLPFLSVSLILWTFISTISIEGCLAFVSAEAVIKQLAVPHYVHVFRVVWKNAIVLAHNLLILPILFLVYPFKLDWSIVVVIPGLFIVSGSVFVIAYFLGMLSSRFRDLPPIVNSIFVIAFYITPVMWAPTLIDDREFSHLLLGLNPLYHLLQIVRLPILGQWPTEENWLVAAGVLAIGAALLKLFVSKFQSRLAYWL